MVEARAASMSATGLATPIKVRPLTPEELTQEQDKDIRYEIVGGEIRYRAALKNGLKEIDTLVRPITPQEALKEAIQDNIGFQPTWFETYLAMEGLVKGPPEMEQKEVAALFEVDERTVSRAIRITKLLNSASRTLIVETLNRKDSAWQINEAPIYRLTDLGDASVIEKALPVVLEKRMNEPQVKELVVHIQAGGDPTQFEPTIKAKRPKRLVLPTPPKDGALEGEGATANALPTPLASHAQHPKQSTAQGHGLPQMNNGQQLLVKTILAGIHWVLKTVGAVLKALFWTPFRGAIHDLAKPFEGFMRFVWFCVIVLALLWAVYDRIFHPGDLTARFKSLMSTVSAKADTGGGASVSRSQTETHDLSVPISKSEIGTAVTQANPSLNKPSSPAKSANDGLSLQSLSNKRSPEVPEELNDRMKNDGEDDAELAKTFFEKSYHNEYEDWQYYFDRKLSEEYCKVFYQKYLTPEKQQDLKDEKIYMTFEPSKPPKLLKFDDFSDDFLVQGVLTTRSDLNYPKKLISRKKVGLIVETYHNSDGSEAVVKVTEVK
jgi:hypothetical protein